jgi:hypothetical protein
VFDYRIVVMGAMHEAAHGITRFVIIAQFLFLSSHVSFSKGIVSLISFVLCCMYSSTVCILDVDFRMCLSW